MFESKEKNEFEETYKMISEFRIAKYREKVGNVDFRDFEIDLNNLIITLLKNCMETRTISKKSAEFYIFDIGLQNSVLIEERRKFIEKQLIAEEQAFTPKFTSIAKNSRDVKLLK